MHVIDRRAVLPSKSLIGSEHLQQTTYIPVVFGGPPLTPEPRFHDLTGGAEMLVVNAAVAAKRAGHEVVVYTSHHDVNRCFEETKEEGMHVLRLYGWLCWRRPHQATDEPSAGPHRPLLPWRRVLRIHSYHVASIHSFDRLNVRVRVSASVDRAVRRPERHPSSTPPPPPRSVSPIGH